MPWRATNGSGMVGQLSSERDKIDARKSPRYCHLMSTSFDRLRQLAKSKEVKHALIELACVALFADRRSTPKEQHAIDKLLSLQSADDERLMKHFETTISHLNSNRLKSDKVIDGISQKLGSHELKTAAMDFLHEFIASDNRVTFRETDVYQKISAAFSK
jgi:hypothetical protein